MYRHLLVPLDSTELSAFNTGEAIRLAASLHARITFFHAVRASSLHAPESATDQKAGTAILSKASTAAASMGVPCAVELAASDHPAEAVLAAAQKHHCDLIVMASHGPSSVLSGSNTSQVLHKTKIALLVTRVEANDPRAATSKVIAILQDEHRSISTVLRAAQKMVQTPNTGSGSPNLNLPALARMVHYLRDFPSQWHHRREEEALHQVLRQRAPEHRALLDRLEMEHKREYDLVRSVAAAVDACVSSGRIDDLLLHTLQLHLEILSRAMTAHIQVEENILLPIARDALTPQDWLHAEHQFAGSFDNTALLSDHSDPAFLGLFAEISRDIGL
ncbi:universal stress protein [Leptothrix ochracea]|uniref:universal stress protein n=1 Tax=Leptothrix ochracea TaxID=735331 RepID=UPI0034E27B63